MLGYDRLCGSDQVVLDGFDRYYATPLDQLPSLKTIQSAAQYVAPKAAASVARAAAPIVRTAAPIAKAVSQAPVVLPTELSARGVAQAGYSTAKRAGEKLIAQKTGVPIKLPSKPTAKALLRSVGSVVPTNIEQAVDTALAVGTQAAASAVTSLLVGAGVGSVVPGLGTIVGVGAALLSNALKGLVKGLFAPPRGRKCTTPWTCPKPPSGYSLMDMLPWLVYQQTPLQKAIDKEQGSGAKCVRGKTVECQNALDELRLTIYDSGITATPPTLGIPQLNRLIPAYQQALAYGQSQGLSPLRLKGFGTTGLNTLLDLMLRRRAAMQQLLARVRALPADRRPPSQLRFQLVEELKRAAVQAAYAPGPETNVWLKTLAIAVNRVEGIEQAAQRQMHQKLQQATQRGQQRLQQQPGAQQAHNLQVLRFRCSDGHQASCAELRRLGHAPATGQRPPARPISPAPPAPPPRPATPDLDARCRAAASALFKKFPAQAKCLNIADRVQILNLCKAAYGPKPTMTPNQAFAATQRLALAACARR